MPDDRCVLCLNLVDENAWREHMKNVHHAVAKPEYQPAPAIREECVHSWNDEVVFGLEVCLWCGTIR